MRRAVKLLSLSLFLLLPRLALACATCKDALGQNPETLGFAKGIYYSIILMFSVLFGIVGFIIYKIVQEARREPDAPAPSQAPQA